MAKKAIVMGATSGIGMRWQNCLLQKDGEVRLPEEGQKIAGSDFRRGGITCYQQTRRDFSRCSALLELIDKLGGMDLYFHSSGIGWQNNTLDIEKGLKTVKPMA